MSDAPNDETLDRQAEKVAVEYAHRWRYSLSHVSVLGFTDGYRAGFAAGRASVTPPTKEAIAEAVMEADRATIDYERKWPDNYDLFNGEQWQAYLLHADAVLTLFAVPPTESEDGNG